MGRIIKSRSLVRLGLVSCNLLTKGEFKLEKQTGDDIIGLAIQSKKQDGGIYDGCNVSTILIQSTKSIRENHAKQQVINMYVGDTDIDIIKTDRINQTNAIWFINDPDTKKLGNFILSPGIVKHEPRKLF